MNATAYIIIAALAVYNAVFAFFAYQGIAKLERKLTRMIDHLWHAIDETALHLDAEIDLVRLNQTVTEISTARNATRKKAAPAAPAVATGRSASKVEAKKVAKKAVAKKAPAKKAAAK